MHLMHFFFFQVKHFEKINEDGATKKAGRIFFQVAFVKVMKTLNQVFMIFIWFANSIIMTRYY